MLKYIMIEDQIQKQMFFNNSERSYLDKLLSRTDIDQIREIIRKDVLTRKDLTDLLHLCTSSESKLVNLSEYLRYIILKFYVWLRETISVAELLYDYQDDLEKLPNGLDDQTKQLFSNCMRLMQHNVKFMVDMYLNTTRTTLSLGGSAFFETLKNKYEISYPQMQQQQQGGFFSNLLTSGGKKQQ